ncbi:MAG: hypothetical protein BWY72_02228 [Bacteroidetes bacterium ADurb.Bin416]|nr:MAG: hypothetical protein BWY72_02228 [Bacteroidetes bacterium ADurb.Bin416]
MSLPVIQFDGDVVTRDFMQGIWLAVPKRTLLVDEKTMVVSLAFMGILRIPE